MTPDKRSAFKVRILEFFLFLLFYRECVTLEGKRGLQAGGRGKRVGVLERTYEAGRKCVCVCVCLSSKGSRQLEMSF